MKYTGELNLTEINTYYANIYLGLRIGYGVEIHPINHVYLFIQDYCNKNKIGITVTPTTFFYVDGSEPGAVVGLIQYPRFPISINELQQIAIDLGTKLLKHFNQYRLSIVFPDTTIMLENPVNKDAPVNEDTSIKKVIKTLNERLDIFNKQLNSNLGFPNKNKISHKVTELKKIIEIIKKSKNKIYRKITGTNTS